MNFQLLSLLILFFRGFAGENGGPVPRNLTATALNSSAIHVTWSEPIIPYRFNYSYCLTFVRGSIEKSCLLNKTEGTITNLNSASTYNLSVQAVDICGTSFRAKAFTSVQTPENAVDIPSGGRWRGNLQENNVASIMSGKLPNWCIWVAISHTLGYFLH